MGKTKRNKEKQKDKKREYKMTLAGQLIKHLGLQMYSGAVPAIAELISNAYDAMAKNVWIDIPLDRHIQENDEIAVRDDGHGMTYVDCNDLYLVVGYERRARSGEWTEPYNGLKSRKVQGRKGIGKLSGFGIANRIDIRSICKKEISHFAMDYDNITKSDRFVSTKGYKPETLEDDAKRTSKKPETHVTLSQLKISRAIPHDQFITGLARRLLVLDANFKVHINGETISRSEIPFQFRFPTRKGKWETTTLENGQEIQWWAGFCKEPIKDDVQRGFVVFVRGKLAQEPWFFDLSGGTWGQHGMQYMTGEIKADFLDETVDLIATDRAAVRWEDPLANTLKDWGQKKVKSLLEQWAEKRSKEKQKSPTVIRYLSIADKLPKRERTVFRRVVERICSIPQIDRDKEGRDLVDDLVEFVYNALTNRSFLEVIRQVNAANPEDRQRFEEVLSEWDIIEAINTAHLVKGRVGIIQKFSEMIEEKVPEKPDMQDYLKAHPWLIDIKWTTLVHEKALDTLLCSEFGLSKSKDKESSKRIDFFCLGDKYQTAHVVEAKRPGKVIGRKEFDQLRDYVLFLRRRLQQESTDPEHQRAVVKGLLIADKIRHEDSGHAQVHQQSGVMDIRTWENLLTSARVMHQDYLITTKNRAPADDPRILELDRVESSIEPSTVSKKSKKRIKKK